MHRLFAPSALILIATNLVPLAGVLFWKWDLFMVLFLYWADTAIIGFWMMVQALREPPAGMGRSGVALTLIFLTLHAGVFMGVHFLFLWTLFSGPWRARVHDGQGFIDIVIVQTGLWLPILVMFVGRGLVMLLDLRRAYAWITSTTVPPLPPAGTSPRKSAIHTFYARIVVMHLAILGGAFLAQAIGTIAPLIVLIAIKTAIDLGFEFWNVRAPEMTVQSAATRR